MPECEICGKKVDTIFEITLDGAQMFVCEKDARGREVQNTFGPEQKRRGAKPVSVVEEPTEEDLMDNYGEEIRKARDALGLPLKVLAERISEKESTLARIEKQRTLPSDKTRQKLEKELGIRLLAKMPGRKSVIALKKGEPITLWDLAEKNEKKGE